MKITRRQLRRIIREAISVAVNKKEVFDDESLDEYDQGVENIRYADADYDVANRKLGKEIKFAKQIPTF